MEYYTKLKIQTINVNGMAEHNKRKKVLTLLESNNCDIFFLQETHCQSIPEWKGQQFTSYNSNRSAGCAILFREGYQEKVSGFDSDGDGRVTMVNLNVGEIKVRLVCIYESNISINRKSFLNRFCL